jgi:peptidoglycan/LPS O-acetylase OafA/YrhL
MGLFRFLLALSVALSHLHHNEKVITEGFVAVQCFFMLSGFYIFKTLSEKYIALKNPIRKFYFSRFLRIIPMYWLSFFALAIWSIVEHKLYPNIPNELASYVFFMPKFNWLQNLHFAFSNIFIVGLDWFYFIGFTSNYQYYFSKAIIGAQELITLKPAWSLSLELMFYVAAPLLVKCKNNILLLLIFALLCLRFYFYSIGLNGLNWVYMFFPFELAIFLLGGLAYRISKKEILKTEWIKSGLFFLLPILLIPITFINLNEYSCWGFYAIVFFVLAFGNSSPKIFSSIDTFLGKLSYPIYIIHFVAVLMIQAVVKSENYWLYGLLLLAFTMPMLFIQNKINTLRNKIT